MPINNNINLLDLHIELFKRGDYSLFTDQNGIRHEKQYQAIVLFMSGLYNDLGFGGGAGGAKSFTWAYLFTMLCLIYPETHWFVCREKLVDLRNSSSITLNKVWKKLGLKDKPRYNGTDHYWQFSNQSRIVYISAEFEPSDPLYDRFGSRELTGGVFEEAQQINFMAFDTLGSRTGRQNNDKYNFSRRVLSTFNPKKGWVYTHYYLPFKNKETIKGRVFLPSLVNDNPFISEDYIENLRNLKDPVQKERLLYGNFDYDDDPSKLIEYDKILNLWTNSFVESGEMFMSCDIAMQGSDKFVIMVWSGWRVIEIYSENKSDPKHIEDIIKAKAVTHKVPQSNIVYDSDGLGNYLRGYLKNAKPFVNNATALNSENYQNLKAQCYYKLAEKINKDEIFINWTDQTTKELLTEELDVVKRHNADKDGKLSILPKEKVKELLGRSPDFSDAMAYRFLFELQPKLGFRTLTKSIHG